MLLGRRSTWIAALMVAAGLAFAPAASAQSEAPPAAAAADAEFHGVNAQGVFKLPAESWDAHLGAIAATGLRVVRRDAFWSDAEPRPPQDGVHSWRWTRHDAVAAALARHGLRWHALLVYGTPWATSQQGPRAWLAPPDDPAAFAAYAAAFAARYGPGGDFWLEHPELPALPVTTYEVWNEPNLERYWPDQANAPEGYADLFVHAAWTIRSTQPEARVIVGGLSSVNVGEFLARMAARQPGLFWLADGVAFHPYGGRPEITYERIRHVRDVLRSLGAGDEPIEITETGWASPPRPEERRAGELQRLAEELPASDCGITRLLIHTWVSAEADWNDPEHWFGIAAPDATLKPSAISYAAGAQRAREAPLEPVAICG
jgi:hypothetical protein